MAYIILKYDDLSQENFASFRRTADYAIPRHIPCAFGLIGQSLEDCSEKYVETLKKWSFQDIELWNHGYFHTDEEFSTASYDDQVYSLTATQKMMKLRLGFAAKTFGSPHNNSTETTIKALANNCPEIENYLFAVDASFHSPAKKMLMRCNYERKTGLPDFAHFLENYESIKDYPYFILQGHPSYWGDAEFAEHNRILDYLLSQGHTFVTPAQLSAIFPLPAGNDAASRTAADLRADANDPIGKAAAEALLACLKGRTFALYGAGEIARELYKFLSGFGLEPDSFIVSDSQPIHDPILCGKPVVHLSDYPRLHDCVTVLALLNTLHDKVRPDLERLGGNAFPARTDADYVHLVHYVRYLLY